MPGKIEGRRKTGRQRMRWPDTITDAMNLNLGKLWETVRDKWGLACCSPWGHKGQKATEQHSCFTMLCQLLLCSRMNQPYTYTYPLPFEFPSYSGCDRALSRVPCAILHGLISLLFYTQHQQCIYVNLNLPIPPTPLSPLVSIQERVRE